MDGEKNRENGDSEKTNWPIGFHCASAEVIERRLNVRLCVCVWSVTACRCAALDATDTDFTYTAFHYQLERHNNITSSAFKLDKYEKQLTDIGDNFQLMRAGVYRLLSHTLTTTLTF